MFNQIRYEILKNVDEEQAIQHDDNYAGPKRSNGYWLNNNPINDYDDDNRNRNVPGYAKLKSKNSPRLTCRSSPSRTVPLFSVLDTLQDQTIFITGATGFIGKVLLEKLLRINVVRRIYVLLRSKKNKTPFERLEEMFQSSPAFNFFNHKSDLNSKVFPIDGDITKKNLGLSNDDLRLLKNEVNIVLHSAASVSFKGKLKMFLEQNALGTDRVMELCTKMINLKAVVYVSTAYANCNLTYIEEKVYPIDAIRDGENIDKFIERIMITYGDQWPKAGSSALCGRANCYTFSKALAETILVKKYSHLPFVICRPSIVTHSLKEPAVGWCDTKNGVSGAMILGGLGIARTMILNCDCRADVVPVDFVVNSIIVMAAYTVAIPAEKRKMVFHITTGEKNPITWGQLLDYSRVSVVNKPFSKQIRPLADKPIVTNSFYGRLSHNLTKIFSHYCFALVADGFILLFGHRPFLLNITKRMHAGFDTLQPFTTGQWHFQHENYDEIFFMLSPKEQELFQSDVLTINWFDYIDDATLGTRRYLLKDEDSTIDKARIRQKYLNIAYRTVEALTYLGIFGTIYYNVYSGYF